MPRCRFRLLVPVLALLAATLACGDLELFGGGDDDAPSAITTMSMVPMSPAPAPGEFVDLAVRIANADNVVSTPFKLHYDQSILRFNQTGSSLGPFLQQDGNLVVFLATPDSQDPGVVSVGLSVLGAEEGVSGHGDLCVLRFEVLPQAVAGVTSIEPFDAFVFSPGLEQQTVLFGELELSVN